MGFTSARITGCWIGNIRKKTKWSTAFYTGFNIHLLKNISIFSGWKVITTTVQQDPNSARKLWSRGCLEKHVFHFFWFWLILIIIQNTEGPCKEYIICLRQVGHSSWPSYRCNWPVAIQFAISITHSAVLAYSESWLKQERKPPLSGQTVSSCNMSTVYSSASSFPQSSPSLPAPQGTKVRVSKLGLLRPPFCFLASDRRLTNSEWGRGLKHMYTNESRVIQGKKKRVRDDLDAL